MICATAVGEMRNNSGPGVTRGKNGRRPETRYWRRPTSGPRVHKSHNNTYCEIAFGILYLPTISKVQLGFIHDICLWPQTPTSCHIHPGRRCTSNEGLLSDKGLRLNSPLPPGSIMTLDDRVDRTVTSTSAEPCGQFRGFVRLRSLLC
jgi:hypothetical protein